MEHEHESYYMTAKLTINIVLITMEIMAVLWMIGKT